MCEKAATTSNPENPNTLNKVHKQNRIPDASGGQMKQDKLPKDGKPPLQLQEEQLVYGINQLLRQESHIHPLISIQPQSTDLPIENYHRFKEGHQKLRFKLNYTSPLI